SWVSGNCGAGRRGAFEFEKRRLAQASGQSGFHRRCGLQGAKDVNGGDGFGGELRRHVICDHRQPKDLDMQLFAARPGGLKFVPAVSPQAEVELVSVDRLLDVLLMAVELIADGRANEIGAVGK